MNKYKIELVWNREFHWCTWKYKDDLEAAKSEVNALVEMGNGERVKKARVVDVDTEEVLYNR